MNRCVQSRCLVLSCMALAILSCSPSPEAGGGIGGTGSVASVASGPVTKFGSVFVSGTEYDNTNTLYCIDHDSCSRENRLKIGMVVLVNGTRFEELTPNQTQIRIAEKITYEETVEGIVQSVASDGVSLAVLGQIVHIDLRTIIDPSIPGQSIGNLVPGTDLVEVSGFVIADGHILATLIMKSTETPHYEILGTVKNHNAKAKTFEIGALLVDYSSANTGEMPSHALSSWNDMVVHVRGDQWSQGGSGPYGARLTATRVESIGLGVEDIEAAELEGFIIQADAPGEFVVNNLRVQTTASTKFKRGSIDDLVVGAHVDIHGQVVSGTMQAEHVLFEGNIELESNVASIDPRSQTLTLAGLSGMTIQISDETAKGGKDKLRRFEDIRVGDHLKIRGIPAGSSGLLATELERSGPASGIKLQGPVRSVLAPVLFIAGASIDTSGIPDNGFRGSDGIVIGRTAFFQDLAVGHKVSLRGTLTGNQVNWTGARRSGGE